MYVYIYTYTQTYTYTYTCTCTYTCQQISTCSAITQISPSTQARKHLHCRHLTEDLQRDSPLTSPCAGRDDGREIHHVRLQLCHWHLVQQTLQRASMKEKHHIQYNVSIGIYIYTYVHLYGIVACIWQQQPYCLIDCMKPAMTVSGIREKRKIKKPIQKTSQATFDLAQQTSLTWLNISQQTTGVLPQFGSAQQ